MVIRTWTIHIIHSILLHPNPLYHQSLNLLSTLTLSVVPQRREPPPLWTSFSLCIVTRRCHRYTGTCHTKIASTLHQNCKHATPKSMLTRWHCCRTSFCVKSSTASSSLQCAPSMVTLSTASTLSQLSPNFQKINSPFSFSNFLRLSLNWYYCSYFQWVLTWFCMSSYFQWLHIWFCPNLILYEFIILVIIFGVLHSIHIFQVIIWFGFDIFNF